MIRLNLLFLSRHILILSVLIIHGLVSAFSQPTLSIRPLPDAVELTFQASAGSTNQVQWIADLGLTNWTTLTNVVSSSNQLMTVIAPVVTNSSARFYRVKTVPVGANAIVIFDNLTQTSDGASIQIAGGDPGFERVRVAAGFKVGSNNHTGTFGFTVRANNPNNSPVNSTLVENNGGVPSETVVFALSSASASNGFYTFTGEGTLTANSTYWLVASTGGSPSSQFGWVNRGAYNPAYHSSATFVGLQVEQGTGEPNDFGWGAQNNFFPGLQITLVPAP